MTIKSSVFDLTNSIKKSEFREEIERLLHELNTTKKDDGPDKIDRGELGYFARNLHMQFMGFLLIDQHRDSIPLQITPLPATEKKKIITCHNEILKINNALFKQFPSDLKEFSSILNPYITANYSKTEITEKKSFYSDTVIEKLADEFQLHPAIEIILRNKPINKLPQQESMANTVLKVQNIIMSQSVHEVPEELWKLINISSQNSKIIQPITKFILGLTVLRTSVQIIDQIIFQSFASTKLKYLNTENVVSLKKHTNNSIGEAITLTSMIDSQSFFIDVNDLVLVDGSIISRPNKYLGWVNQMAISFSDETGNLEDISMRMVDENLNPFSNLLEFSSD